MVSSTVVENGKSSPPRKSCAAGIGPGNYQLVGWDMDTTGKRVIDEICQIAGYTPNSSFSQYVMPYKNLNPPAMKRHNMKVVTIGKYRALKDNKTNKVIKTKSEVFALTDFLTWLESIKGDATDGIILVYHEPRKVIPAMLIESLKKYNLLDGFKQIVKGFANGFNVAEMKCTNNTVHSFSLRTLSKTLLNQEKQLDNAKNRAYLALQIVQHLSSLEGTKENETNGSGDGDSAMKKTIEFIREFVQPVEMEEQEYAELKIVFERQNSLRPIFGVYRENRRERQHASPLRRLLAEAGIEYTLLQEAWNNEKKEGLEKLIKMNLTTVDEKQIEDLLIILEGHFDPDKKSKLRITGDKNEIKTENSKIIADKENNNKCDSGAESSETSSPIKAKTEPPENSSILTQE
ncbi:maternal protein exuperantia-1 [Osmia bicornis bicornis]|uniref:maternal protein exuperantia-1 n=1 Tax=Osmia bicornis bicornis TaxID=1437191 RepID=UPI0010F4A3E4|nr:maternal protein exuperantia-1 [Osmia bicornis bicornis]XP_029032768.1 maternal protein exuperantia-1 [Osmia bicornis bicornis]XP_029032769.1 maternal protein exuperantia-1 [Osmia bicornis bicornis]